MNRWLVNISAGSSIRRWPNERWVALIEHLRIRRPSATVAVMGSVNEWDSVREVALASGAAAVRTESSASGVGYGGDERARNHRRHLDHPRCERVSGSDRRAVAVRVDPMASVANSAQCRVLERSDDRIAERAHRMRCAGRVAPFEWLRGTRARAERARHRACGEIRLESCRARSLPQRLLQPARGSTPAARSCRPASSGAEDSRCRAITTVASTTCDGSGRRPPAHCIRPR